jgi:hypothetical protein
MKVEKLLGFKRIFQAESFPNDVDAMFVKNKGERVPSLAIYMAYRA